MQCNKQQGFTLIELMIVIAIIAILAAIIAPIISGKSSSQAPVNKCIDGFVFVPDRPNYAFSSETRWYQMIGADGKPVLCGANGPVE